MSEINFLPVCSNCRTILDDQLIDIAVEETSDFECAKYVERRSVSVVPRLCPKCREFFTCITMPTKIPVQPTRKGPGYYGDAT